MGKTILTCGHEAKPEDGPHGLGWLIGTEGETRACEPCINYRSVCSGCFKEYFEEELIVDMQHSINNLDESEYPNAPPSPGYEDMVP